MKLLITILTAFIITIGCSSANKPTNLLIKDLKSNDRDIRLSAAWLLGQRGEEAVPTLSEALNDTDKGIQYAAMFSLVNIGTKDAKEALSKVLPILENDLTSEDKELRKTAAELLKAIGSPDAHAILKKYGIDRSTTPD
jgi:HEAT repeat protein